MPGSLQENIIAHLTALEELKHYFPEACDKELNLVRNPFKCSVNSIPDEHKDELIDLQNDSTTQDLLGNKTVEKFWIHMISLYPNVAKVALHSLPPFVSTYLCESGFSTMPLLKTKHRNHLELEDDVRCALSETCMDKLINNKQYQTSH